MKCSNKQCTSAMDGKWKPHVLLWYEGARVGSHQPISVTCDDLLVCDQCRKHLKVRHFVAADIDGWQKNIAKVIHYARRRPDLRTAQITYTLEDSLTLKEDAV